MYRGPSSPIDGITGDIIGGVEGIESAGINRHIVGDERALRRFRLNHQGAKELLEIWRLATRFSTGSGEKTTRMQIQPDEYFCCSNRNRLAELKPGIGS